MAPMSTTPQLETRDFSRIASALRHIDEHWQAQPRIEVIARAAGLSTFHFSRLFRRWAGVTPKQYLEHLTARAARRALGNETSVLAAAHAVGLSGPGRLHDLTITVDAMTPGELKAGGRGVELRYGFAPSPFGTIALGATSRGIAHLQFVDDTEERTSADRMRLEWPNAILKRDDAHAVATVDRLWGSASTDRSPLKLAVRGTNFELKVWRALLDINCGTTSYGALARELEVPGSARAIGNAVGANRIAWIIPCHRVLRANGALGGYRWGEDRKRAMLAWESLREARKAAS